MSTKCNILQKTEQSVLTSSSYHQRDEELFKPAEQSLTQAVEEMAHGLIGDIVRSRKRIDLSLDDFQRECSQVNQQFTQYILQLFQDLSTGNIVEPSRVQNVKFLQALAKEVQKRHFETAEQLIQLEELNRQGKFKEYTEIIEVSAQAMINHLKYFRSKVELLQTQENHELQLLVSKHNQKLKENAQRIDQVMKMAEFESREKEREFRRKIDLRSQNMQEGEDFLLLAKASQQLDDNFERVERQFQQDLSELRIQMNAFV